MRLAPPLCHPRAGGDPVFEVALQIENKAMEEIWGQSERLPPQAFGQLLLTKEERCDVLT